MAEKSTHGGRPRPHSAVIAGGDGSNTEPPAFLSNAEIADRLASLAQLLSAQKENPYKVKAYQRAAAKLRNMSESLQELVQEEADLAIGRYRRRHRLRHSGNRSDGRLAQTGRNQWVDLSTILSTYNKV